MTPLGLAAGLHFTASPFEKCVCVCVYVCVCVCACVRVCVSTYVRVAGVSRQVLPVDQRLNPLL
jgi:hypothetical protein